MKRGVLTFFCLGGLLTFVPASRAINHDTVIPASQADATGSEQPYSTIWTRNVFDLKPPEDKSAQSKDDVAPPSNIKLVGIYTIFGKRALLSVQEQNAPGKPGRPAPSNANKEEYYNMSEGERHGALELVEINPSARTVKIKNNDVESTITFETNRAPSAPMAGGVAPHMGGGIPGYAPPVNTVPNNGNSVPLPSRAIRSASQNAFNNNQPTYSPTGSSTGYAQPGYGGGLGSLFNQPVTQAQQPAPELPSLEEQAAMLALQHATLDPQIESGQLKSPPLPAVPGTTQPGEFVPGNGETPAGQAPPWVAQKFAGGNPWGNGAPTPGPSPK